MIENKKYTLCLVLFFVFIFVIIGYFCIASLATAYGYEQAVKARILERKDALLVYGNDNNTERFRTVVIDAGHGGEDPGAVANGLEEKNLNLSIAIKLADFMGLSSCDVVMTRETDKLLYDEGQQNRKKFYDLRNRLAIAENAPNPVFISVHINKFPQQSSKGLQTFYSRNLPESKSLATAVQELSRLADSSNKRMIKPADDTIYILDNINVPAILVECGFISNKEEATLLNNDDYQKRLAFLIYCATERFLNE